MIKAGIFDVGNVLIHWNGQLMADDISRELHIAPEIFWKIWNEYEDKLDRGLMNEQAFWKNFLEESGQHFEMPTESLIAREFAIRFNPNNEMIVLVKNIKTMGLKTAILSNTNEPHALFLRSKAMYEGFDTVVLSNEVGLRKPAPKIYELVLERLGVQAQETFFVDDLQENIDVANTLGIHGILIESNEQVKRDIAKLGVNLN